VIKIKNKKKTKKTLRDKNFSLDILDFSFNYWRKKNSIRK
jgi:hypothetical protein